MRKQINWLRVLLFLVIATTISNIFRFDVFEIKPELQKLPTWIFILVSVLLEGGGVIIAALIAFRWLKKNRETEMSIFGTSKNKSIIMATIPIVVLTIIGVNNTYNLEKNFFGFIAIFGTLIYCVFEEFGWRGYLQEELKFIKPWQQYILIGFLWYFWHLSFLKNITLANNLFFLGMMIFGSWGIGQVAQATKSILASACFHLLIQIMMFNPLIRNGITGTQKIIILVTIGFTFFAIVKKWEKENNDVFKTQ